LNLLFGGSILLRSRLLLSLVVTLSLSTLALANSAQVTISSFHSGSGTSVTPPAYSSVAHSSINGGTATTVMIGKGIADSSATHGTFLGSVHGTISHKDGNWAVWNHRSAPLSTPEPGSLMLLSTGLVGVAGIVRRKLLRN
jgi:hypothetical protein